MFFTGEEQGFDGVNWRLLTQLGSNGAGVWTPGRLPPVPPALLTGPGQLVPECRRSRSPASLGGEWGTGRGGGLAQRPHLDALEKEGVKSLCKEICK